MKKLLTKRRLLFDLGKYGRFRSHMNNIREVKAILSIATINATVIGIVMALLLGYATYSYTIISKLEFDALHEAERINKIHFARSVYLPEKEFRLPTSKKDYDDSFTAVCLLLTSETKSLPPFTQNYYGLPTNSVSRARKALSILNILGHRYPFAESISKTSSWIKHAPKPFYFSDFEVLRRWKTDLDEFLQSSGCFQLIGLSGLSSNNNVLRALVDSEKELIEKSRTNRILQSIGSAEPGYLIEDFLNNLARADEISQSVGYRISLADQYKERTFPKSAILLITVVAGFAFLFGVILPMLFEDLHKAFYVYFPSIFYVFLFGFIVWWMINKIM